MSDTESINLDEFYDWYYNPFSSFIDNLSEMSLNCFEEKILHRRQKYNEYYLFKKFILFLKNLNFENKCDLLYDIDTRATDVLSLFINFKERTRLDNIEESEILCENDFEFLKKQNPKPFKKMKQNKKKQRLCIISKKIERENCKLLRKSKNVYKNK